MLSLVLVAVLFGQQVKNVQSIQASAHAFAAILGDGTVVTWGHTASGGDSTAVQDQLKNVRQIQASTYAFAAIVGDGSVVTWGEADGGGDSNAVQHQLKNVQQIQATRGGFGGAFAAILGDGSVVTWGNVGAGGDSNAAQHQLKNVAAGPSHWHRLLLPRLALDRSYPGVMLCMVATAALRRTS